MPPSEESSEPEPEESSEPEEEPSFEESSSVEYEVSDGYIVVRAKDVKNADEFLGDIEREIIDLVNEEREYEGLSSLEFNETLRTAARVRSKELLLNDHFDHTRPDGRAWQTVFDDAVPMSYRAAGENLATITMERGYKSFTAEDWMDLWMNSESHRENILRDGFTHIGVGVCFEKDGDSYTAYATQLFATY